MKKKKKNTYLVASLLEKKDEKYRRKVTVSSHNLLPNTFSQINGKKQWNNIEKSITYTRIHI